MSMMVLLILRPWLKNLMSVFQLRVMQKHKGQKSPGSLSVAAEVKLFHFRKLQLMKQVEKICSILKPVLVYTTN